MRLSRAIEFSSSLRYARPDLSDAENRTLFGEYARRHGHNYRLEVTLEGEPDPVTGMVINLTDLNHLLEKEIMERFDHRDLVDDTDFFDRFPATPENLARVIWDLLEPTVPDGLLSAIRLYRDADLYVDMDGPAA